MSGRVFFDENTLSVRLGTSFTAGIEVPNGNGFSFWVNAVVLFGNAMHVYRFKDVRGLGVVGSRSIP